MSAGARWHEGAGRQRPNRTVVTRRLLMGALPWYLPNIAEPQLKEVIEVRNTKPTINDVARVAGVSRTTASRVLNDKPGVSRPLRQRVRQAVARLSYQPNENARALASGGQRAVGLITVDFSPGLALGAAISALENANVHLHIKVFAENRARCTAVAETPTQAPDPLISVPERDTPRRTAA